VVLAVFRKTQLILENLPGPVLVWSQQNYLKLLLNPINTRKLARSCLGVEPAELLEIAVDHEVFRVLGLLPRHPPERKSGHENE